MRGPQPDGLKTKKWEPPAQASDSRVERHPSVDPLGLFLDGGVPAIHLCFTRNLSAARSQSTAGGGPLDEALLLKFLYGTLKSLQAHPEGRAQPFLGLRLSLLAENLNDLLF